MLNEYCAKRFCSEDISLIENYQEAIADQTKMWDTHHRRECDSEGKTLFTKKQLIDMNLYYNRPASELIFVTRSMHNKIHREMRYEGGKKNAIKSSIPIIQFSKDGILIKEWPSTNEAERRLGISQSSICHCLKGRRKLAGGFIWRYKHGRI